MYGSAALGQDVNDGFNQQLAEQRRLLNELDRHLAEYEAELRTWQQHLRDQVQPAATTRPSGTGIGSVAVIAGAVALTWWLTKKGK